MMNKFNAERIFRKDTTEFRYVVTRNEQTQINVSKNLKMVLKVYQHHEKIRTLAEAVWRACALGIRYDLIGDDPQIQAYKEISEIILKHIREKRER